MYGFLCLEKPLLYMKMMACMATYLFFGKPKKLSLNGKCLPKRFFKDGKNTIKSNN